MSEPLAAGVDLGGTKIGVGIVTAGGRLLAHLRVPTGPEREAEAILADMADAVRQALALAGLRPDDLEGVGLGSPAPLDMDAGVILETNNLLTLHGFPIVARLSEAIGRPVVLNNDANCFGLAEALYGAGAGARVCCGFTLGTGLGGFLVLDGRLFDGPRGAAAEVWASPYQGDQIEEKVSGRGLARNYRKLTERVATAQQVAALAREGDPDAREAWREFGADLAVPIAWMCNALDPDLVVLGGSMAAAWDLFCETMLHQAAKYTNAVNRRAVRIVPGTLGDQAGVIGAAALVFGKADAGRPPGTHGPRGPQPPVVEV
ncbi:MAG: ROK family protein [Candidatus Brocadiaceae bacterium]|nr:ROK family protein [Candidatus Brocadiaceae bacterium]